MLYVNYYGVPINGDGCGNYNMTYNIIFCYARTHAQELVLDDSDVDEKLSWRYPENDGPRLYWS